MSEMKEFVIKISAVSVTPSTEIPLKTSGATVMGKLWEVF
jgi:hypothetical protein